MQKFALIFLVLFTSSALPFLSGCEEIEIDYFSQVEDLCNTPLDGGRIWELSNPNESYIFKHLPECKARLEEILPFDDSFDGFPEIKDKVLEGFYAYMAYPLAFPPDDRILGVSPGSIPIYLTEILTKDGPGNINKNWFNHIVNKIDVIHYETEKSGGPGASFAGDPASLLTGKLTIYPEYYIEIESYSSMHWSSWRPFNRAGTMAHEARHGDSYFHHACLNIVGSGCDGDLNGAVGAGIIYYEMLLHGSYGKLDKNGFSYLSHNDLKGLFQIFCKNLKRRIDHKSNELQARLDQIDCNKIDVNQMLEFEGLK